MSDFDIDVPLSARKLETKTDFNNKNLRCARASSHTLRNNGNAFFTFIQILKENSVSKQ